MIDLHVKIENEFIMELFNEIDNNIICESLNCKILKDLAAQLKKQYEYEKDDNKQDRWGASRPYNQKFKEIFNGYGAPSVRWDQISDSDFEEIDMRSADPKTQKKTEQKTHKLIQDKFKGMCIVYNPESKAYEYVFFNWGYVIQLNSPVSRSIDNHAGSRTGYRANRSWHDLKVNEKLALIKNKIVYFADLTDKLNQRKELQNKRTEDKKGMVLLDEYSLKRMAENNAKRYKEIVAKNKANRLNNTALLDEAGELIQKISVLATDVAKHPVDKADLIYPVQQLCNYVYDTQRYILPGNRRDKGYYSGVNGLLPLVMKYTKLLKDLQTSGGYEHQRKEFEECQKSMKVAIDNIKKIAADANINFNEIQAKEAA